MELLVYGAFGYGEAVGYTLYYATNFIFTGLAVASPSMPGCSTSAARGRPIWAGWAWRWSRSTWAGCRGCSSMPLAILAGRPVRRRLGADPGWLQARRGSHVVITTIMLNFVAAALMTYLMVNVLIAPGQSARRASPSRDRLDAAAQGLLGLLGVDLGYAPVNLSLVLALLCCVVVWLFVWRSRIGYELRVVGHSEAAAVYGGISPARRIILAMTISGALAGLMATNEILGAQHRLILGFTGGYGFVGIAVALMGRNHPVGIVLAASCSAPSTRAAPSSPSRCRAVNKRPGRRHPGPGDPVRRRAGEHVPAPARGACSPAAARGAA